MFREISHVDKWFRGILEIGQQIRLPSSEKKEEYIINSLMNEAIASSQLEGAATEYKVAKEMLRSGRKPTDKNEQMIVNNWQAIQYIRKNANEKLSIDMLCEIQFILTKNTFENPEESGKFRVRDDIVVRYKNEEIYEPPSATVLPSHMEALCAFANFDDETKWIHPLIKGAMLHFWIGYDHPFTDGNGRTARAVMYWYLLSRGYFLFQYLSISKHFLTTPGQYVRAYLYTETDDNDLTYFLLYNLSSVRAALEKLLNYLKQKQEEIVNADKLLRTFRGLNARQKKFIYHALQHPDHPYTIAGYKITNGIAYDTARKDLADLEKSKFIKHQREGKKLLVYYLSEKTIEKLRKSNPGQKI